MIVLVYFYDNMEALSKLIDHQKQKEVGVRANSVFHINFTLPTCTAVVRMLGEVLMLGHDLCCSL